MGKKKNITCRDSELRMKWRCEGMVDDVDQKSLLTKKTEWHGTLLDEKAHPCDVSHGCFQFR